MMRDWLNAKNWELRLHNSCIDAPQIILVLSRIIVLNIKENAAGVTSTKATEKAEN